MRERHTVVDVFSFEGGSQKQENVEPDLEVVLVRRHPECDDRGHR